MIRRAALGAFVFLLAGCCLLAAPGCGGGAIVEHARAARIVGPVLTGVGETIVAARAANLDACAHESDVRLCLDTRGTAWEPAVAAYNLAREAFVAWVAGMEIANLSRMSDTEATDYLLPLLSALVGLYSGVEIALEPFEEIDLPDFPGLSLLAHGGS